MWYFVFILVIQETSNPVPQKKKEAIFISPAISVILHLSLSLAMCSWVTCKRLDTYLAINNDTFRGPLANKLFLFFSTNGKILLFKIRIWRLWTVCLAKSVNTKGLCPRISHIFSYEIIFKIIWSEHPTIYLISFNIFPCFLIFFFCLKIKK